jgi:putative hemolysin
MADLLKNDNTKLYSLDFPRQSIWGKLASPLIPLIEDAFAVSGINGIHRRVAPGGAEGFLARVLADLNITFHAQDADLTLIPAKGPLVVVANHPFGAIEGIVLMELIRKVRPDVKVMANFLLDRIPELREQFVCVDPFGGSRSTTYNMRPMREALRWLKDGGVLAVFPAGEVAHLDRRTRKIAEPAWSSTVARVVRHAAAPVLPVFFEGHNSWLFQLAGLIHPRLRTALLPRQLMKMRGKTIHLRVGAVIPNRRLSAIESDTQMTDYLRQRVLLLQHRQHADSQPSFHRAPTHPAAEPIIAPIPVDVLAEEVAQLPKGQLLVDGGEHHVYLATARQAPQLLQEIGRLREVTYRASGEGTGKSIDLDDFDNWYQHLFVWDTARKQVLGAYRLGASDQILAARGSNGLYTNTLFEFKPELLERLNPAVELGRAFVRPEAQKSFAPLMLLWKGIGRFVSLNPWYKVLFGPVSISNDYQLNSRQLMVGFLRSNHLASEFRDMARARNPFESEAANGLDELPVGPDDIDDLVSELEPDRKGLPVLLRQYLKLGAKFFSFNIDSDFGDAIDALMYVDLTRTDPRILDRYMGRESARQFLAYHHRKAEAMGSANATRN